MADLTVVKRLINDVDVSAGGGTLAAVTDLDLAVLAGEEIFFEYTLHYSTGNNIGARFGVNSTGAGTVRVGSIQPIDTTTVNFGSTASLNTEIFVATAGGNAVQRMAIVAGVFVATAPGTLSIQAASESGGAMTVYAQSSALFQYVGADAKAGTDTIASPVTEATASAVTLRQAETVPTALEEVHWGLDVAGTEGLAVGLGEAATKEEQEAPATPIGPELELVPVGLTDAATATLVGIDASGVDALAVALTEFEGDDRDLASPLTINLAEGAAGAGAVAQAEALPFPLAGETSVAADVTPATLKDGADSLATPLQEAQAALGTADQAETLATPFTEALSSLLGALQPVESLPVALAEAPTLQVTLQVGDAVATTLVEAPTLESLVASLEAVAVGLGEAEALIGLAVIQVTDAAGLVLEEAPALLALVQLSDPVAVTLFEPTEADVDLEGLLALLPLGLVEALGIAVTVPPETDPLPVGLSETAEVAGLATIQEPDPVALALTETGALAIFNVIAALESLGLSLATAQALAVSLLQAEALGLSLTDAVTSVGTQQVADQLGLALSELEAALALLGSAATVGVTLETLAAVLTLAESVDALPLVLAEAPASLAAVWVILGADTLPISLEETSAILASVTAIRRVGLTTVDSRMPDYTVEAVIRSWEVECVSPFPYTVAVA